MATMMDMNSPMVRNYTRPAGETRAERWLRRCDEVQRLIAQGDADPEDVADARALAASCGAYLVFELYAREERAAIGKVVRQANDLGIDLAAGAAANMTAIAVDVRGS